MGTKGNDSFIQQPEEPTSGTLDAQTFKLVCNRVQYPSQYFLWEESNCFKTYLIGLKLILKLILAIL